MLRAYMQKSFVLPTSTVGVALQQALAPTGMKGKGCGMCHKPKRRGLGFLGDDSDDGSDGGDPYGASGGLPDVGAFPVYNPTDYPPITTGQAYGPVPVAGPVTPSPAAAAGSGINFGSTAGSIISSLFGGGSTARPATATAPAVGAAGASLGGIPTTYILYGIAGIALVLVFSKAGGRR